MPRFLFTLVLCLALPLLAGAQDTAKADEDLLRQAGLKTDGPALLEYLTRQVENRKRIPELIRQLGDNQFTVREKATSDLIALGPPAVIHLEAAYSNSLDGDTVRRARHCLEQIGRKSDTLPAVLRLLALKKPEGAVPVLLDSLPHLDERFLDEFCTTLAAVAGLPADGPALLEYLTRQVENGKRIPELVRQLGDRRFTVREKATEDLIALGSVAISALEAASQDADREVAQRAARCLEAIRRGSGGQRNAAAVRLLAITKPAGAARVLLDYLPFAEDEMSQQEVCSALTVTAVRDGRSNPALVLALSDKNPLKRAVAAETLVQVKAVEHQAAVRKLLNDAESSVRLRVALALLTQARDKEAVPVLIELLTELAPEQSWKVETVLAQLAAKEVPARWALASSRVYRGALAAWWNQRAQRIDLKQVDFFFYPPGDQELKGHQNYVLYVAFSPDGRKLVSGSLDRTLRLWDSVAGKEIRQFQGHQKGVTGVAVSPDGRMLASGSDDKTVRLWDVASGKELWQRQGNTYQVFCVAFSPDGRMFASGGNDTTVRLWDVATGKELRQFQAVRGRVSSVAFSPDGRALACGEDDAIRLCDVATGQTLWRQKWQFEWKIIGYATCVRFSPDGRMLATSGIGDRRIRLFDVATGREVRQFQGHQDHVRTVAFSPDGRTLASGSDDSTIRLWDVATGKELRQFQRPGIKGILTSVVFSPDGRRLAATAYNWDSALIWDLSAEPPKQ